MNYSMAETKPQPYHRQQTVVVMRHGDRLDRFDPLWTATASRPWDPPLVEAGKVRAFCTGERFRSGLGFPIHRVFVSPFLRCVQTAAAAVSALCADGDDGPDQRNSDHGVIIDSSKVSIEYGLCQMLNTEVISANVAPKDGNFTFNIPELEALFPAGTVDHYVDPVYQEFQQWQETVMGARTRYQQIVKSLADKYPSENLLLVTHSVGVAVAVSTYMKNIWVDKSEYCAYSQLKRSISWGEGKSFTVGEFEVVQPMSGVNYIPLPATAGDSFAQSGTI